MPSQLFMDYGLFARGNTQVTSGNAKQARSESFVVANPNNADNLIAASKKFSNPSTYRFSIGIRVSFDGGLTWTDAHLPTLLEWGDFVGVGGHDASAGMTDPAVTFDGFGNAFMVGEPIRYMQGGEIDTIGMYIYKSTDGGLHWSNPIPLHVGDLVDDKSWIACDNQASSPFYGHVYVVWGALGPLRFSRSTDHGASWKGVGNSAPGSQLATPTFAPEISVGLDGTVHIAWHFDGEDSGSGPGSTIEYMRSTDGGETFEAQKSIVSGVQSLRGHLNEIDSWPVFPGATFRVLTIVTSCGFGVHGFGGHGGPHTHYGKYNRRHYIVAWSDYREGVARIYFRTSSDAGASFDGPVNGLPLLAPQSVPDSLHHFHPQIEATATGVVGCAYYEYGQKGGKNLIDVLLSVSRDHGKNFSETARITSSPWDPAIDAPFSHGDSQVTFIGEYFGLDADKKSFDILWTDTRTGVQELFFDRVATERFDPPGILDGIVAEILFGVIQDGGGVAYVNGHLIRIPPRGPEYDLLQALAALDIAANISGSAGRTLTRSIYTAIESIAKTAGKQVQR